MFLSIGICMNDCVYICVCMNMCINTCGCVCVYVGALYVHICRYIGMYAQCVFSKIRLNWKIIRKLEIENVSPINLFLPSLPYRVAAEQENSEV